MCCFCFVGWVYFVFDILFGVVCFGLALFWGVGWLVWFVGLVGVGFWVFEVVVLG